MSNLSRSGWKPCKTLVLRSTMGSLSVTSPATLPFLDQKVHTRPTHTSKDRLCRIIFRLKANHNVCVAGVNIGGAGSYVYDNPVNEAPAAVPVATDGKAEEEKKAPARGPVKGKTHCMWSENSGTRGNSLCGG